ncbi:MAG: TetR/AcrR family transcriptional regulator [Paracoccaceae bacterium]
MARPREFETNKALAKAMDVFWQRGYSDATLPDLLAGMNLTRGSLYKAFKDKKSLFLLVLSNYDEQAVGEAVDLLTNPEQDGLERISELFGSIVLRTVAGDRRGCLLCSAISGPASYDSDIAEHALRSLDRMRGAFQVALQASMSSSDATRYTPMLVSQYVGLQVMSQSSVPASMIRDSVEAIGLVLQKV